MIAYGYTLYRRYSKRKRSHVYYAQFRDGKTGRRLPGRSTGQTSKSLARRWCEEQLRDGFYVSEGEMRFSEYAKDWWVWGKCPYIQRKLDREQSFSPGTAESYRLNLHNYILPFFGTQKLNRISMDAVEQFLHDLRLVRRPNGKPLSGKSVNNILSTLRVMLDRAVDLGYLPRNPARRINISASFNQMVRRSLTREEGLRVLDYCVGDNSWRNKRYYALNLVAAVCGLRLGECRGL
ncbi:MAG: site-specific integrase [Spirochaetota bacterium]